MSQWALELLAHYCVTKYDEQGNISAMSIAAAFKRCLMILSSGFFLPGSAGIRDPIERDGRSVHQNFSKTDQDQICATAQTLLRYRKLYIRYRDGYQCTAESYICTVICLSIPVVVPVFLRSILEF